MIRNLLVVGGDLRMELMGSLLGQEGYQVECLREAQGAWGQKVEQADLLLFPYPFALKEGLIPGWKGGGEAVEEILRSARPGTLIAAGAGLEAAVAACSTDSSQLLLFRYADDPVFLQRNADISAEAAVCEAMQRSGCMLDEQQVLLLGYGLFAQAIAWRLRALGCRVWAAARREKQRTQAMADGVQAVEFQHIPQLISRMNIIINTVPSVIIGREMLEWIPEHTLLMELASPPYGFDLSAAVELERNVIVLPGLPSRYAPISAARALKAAVLHRIVEGSL